MISDYKELVENMRNNGDCITADIIEQLYINNDLLKNECDGLALQYGKCASNYAKLQIEYDTLAKMYAKVNEDLCVRTKERDAAVADLAEGSFCMNCKHLVSTKEEKPCRHCSSLTGGGEDNWEWRGVQEDNDETD